MRETTAVRCERSVQTCSMLINKTRPEHWPIGRGPYPRKRTKIKSYWVGKPPLSKRETTWAKIHGFLSNSLVLLLRLSEGMFHTINRNHSSIVHGSFDVVCCRGMRSDRVLRSDRVFVMTYSPKETRNSLRTAGGYYKYCTHRKNVAADFTSTCRLSEGY